VKVLNNSNIDILLIFLILISLLYRCHKAPPETCYCDNCITKIATTESLNNKIGWIVFSEDFNKYLIEVPFCNKHIFYVLCQLPLYFSLSDNDTVVFSGTIIDDPYTPSDNIPKYYYCIKLDTIAFDREYPDPETLPQGLSGTWIEIKLGIDTLIFPTNDDEGWLWFKNCMYNFKAGLPYPYRIVSPDSIFIMDPTSSEMLTAMGKNYYFKFDESSMTFYIEHFTYRLYTQKNIQTFKKIN
jgi:hypothetical protein